MSTWIIIIALGITWGSSFILIKKSLLALTPYEVAAMRLAITGISLSPFLFYYRKEVQWERWPSFLLIALTGSAIPFLLYPIAETRIDSALAGVLNSLTPLFTLMFSVILFGNKSNKYQLFGVLAGLLGAFVLIMIKKENVEETPYFYALLVVFATVLYGLNANLVKQFFQDTRAIITTSFSYGLLIIPSVVYIISVNTIPKLMSHPEGMKSFIAVSLLSLLGTSLATIVFFMLLKRTTAVFGSSVAYLIPIIAIGFGVWDGEQFALNHILGTALIISALKIISIKRKK